jgi:hypothetical protein
MLVAKCRHREPENAGWYLDPSPEVIAELTGLRGPGEKG